MPRNGMAWVRTESGATGAAHISRKSETNFIVGLAGFLGAVAGAAGGAGLRGSRLILLLLLLRKACENSSKAGSAPGPTEHREYTSLCRLGQPRGRDLLRKGLQEAKDQTLPALMAGKVLCKKARSEHRQQDIGFLRRARMSKPMQTVFGLRKMLSSQGREGTTDRRQTSRKARQALTRTYCQWRFGSCLIVPKINSQSTVAAASASLRHTKQCVGREKQTSGWVGETVKSTRHQKTPKFLAVWSAWTYVKRRFIMRWNSCSSRCGSSDPMHRLPTLECTVDGTWPRVIVAHSYSLERGAEARMGSRCSAGWAWCSWNCSSKLCARRRWGGSIETAQGGGKLRFERRMTVVRGPA